VFRKKNAKSKSDDKMQSQLPEQQHDKQTEVQQKQQTDITNLQWPELDDTEKHMQGLTFKDDEFEREIFAVQLNRMIQNSKAITENESLSIAIDASWGMGKSQFIHMWRNKLKDDTKKWKTVYYNAWKYDDYADAIAPIACEICKEYQEDLKKDRSFLLATTNILKIGISALTAIASAAFPVLGPLDNIGKAFVSTIGERPEDGFYRDNFKRENAKADFRKALKDLVSENEKLVIFVDELDRCRPSFAIETLEVMKHFFNVDKVAFVFSLDIQQLSKSIATVYGQNMDSSGYLSRFFDCQLRLPPPTENQLYKISGFGSEAYPYYLATCRILKMSVREIKALLRLTIQFEASTVLGMFKKQNFSLVDAGNCFFFFLFALKLKDPECFTNLLRSDVAQDNKYAQTAKISNFFNFIYELRDLGLDAALRKIEDIGESNRRSAKTGLVISLNSFFVNEITSAESESIPFIQWLEQRVEIFMGDNDSKNESAEVVLD
jgi:hypothetical protein